MRRWPFPAQTPAGCAYHLPGLSFSQFVLDAFIPAHNWPPHSSFQLCPVTLSGLPAVYVSSSRRVDIADSIFFKFFFKILFILERGGEGEWERNINMWLPLVHPLLGTWPTTQACALTGN